jgi:hypothetical protein
MCGVDVLDMVSNSQRSADKEEHACNGDRGSLQQRLSGNLLCFIFFTEKAAQANGVLTLSLASPWQGCKADIWVGLNSPGVNAA